MKKRGLRNRFLKPAWTLHKWLGLIFALPVLITALTGALLHTLPMDRTVF